VIKPTILGRGPAVEYSLLLCCLGGAHGRAYSGALDSGAGEGRGGALLNFHVQWFLIIFLRHTAMHKAQAAYICKRTDLCTLPFVLSL